MKVLHVIPSLSPTLGGPTQVALQIVKSLRHQGIDAEIVTTNYDETKLLDVPLNQCVEYQDVPVWFLPAFPHPFKEYIFSSALTRWLWQNIDRYDILDNHYLFSYASTCAGAIARCQKVPYTVRTQGQLSSWALKQSSLKKQFYTAIIERHNLNQAAAIHCTTLEEVEDLKKFGIKTPTITLPLGVDPPEQISSASAELHNLYNIPQEKLIILFLSRLHYKKRPNLLINSLNKIVAQNNNFHLIMAGSGEADYLNYLQKLVHKHQLTNHITFTGFITGRNKHLLLQGSDIFVLPSYSENFGIAVAEAMVAGLPVIITPGVQIAPEIATADAGIIIEDEAGLTNAITQLLNSEAMRSRLGKNAMVLANDKYAWKGIVSQLICSYQEIVNTLMSLSEISY
ncbi:glycosyltransferase [Pleurocapsa sp. PCC 7319]|uniref:glycosyltransferase n=1 Tax=Pleurocapsa sp. PCC 7319 TaxID=118161 RepID=UPI000345C4EB|nr:glycosyltransferase [Pleurocapsa sp. PCC 7319]